MPTTSSYGVFDVSHVAMFIIFGGTCVSDYLGLGWDLLLVMEI